MTVWELKEQIKMYWIPDDAEVFVERVEDIYFEKHWWKTRKKYSSFCWFDVEYIPSFCVCKYKWDWNLYIDQHY